MQRIIDDLFQYVERLQERKADRENVATEMDVKADKHALDGKVNRSTFEETFQMFDREYVCIWNEEEDGEVLIIHTYSWASWFAKDAAHEV